MNAVNAQNLTLPAGTAKIGDKQYTIKTNSIPATIADLNNIPLKFANGATVFMKDIGQVRDAYAVQQNIVRKDGLRAVLLTVIKNGNASTLDVVKGVKAALNAARAAAPPGLDISELFDQSTFVTNSVESVVREGVIAGALTALMILLFLGSWRSTLIVMISIPLAILASLVTLYFLGHTLNTMTLGGLALAVGILVDDSTVTIENTHRLLTEEKMPLAQATLHGSAGIAVPTLVSTARDLLRVHLGRVPRRPRQISVHAARPCGRVCDARLLCAIADADSDHHRAFAQERASRLRRCAARAVLAASTTPSNAASRPCARVMRACSECC